MPLPKLGFAISTYVGKNADQITRAEIFFFLYKKFFFFFLLFFFFSFCLSKNLFTNSVRHPQEQTVLETKRASCSHEHDSHMQAGLSFSTKYSTLEYMRLAYPASLGEACCHPIGRWTTVVHGTGTKTEPVPPAT